MKKAKLMNTLGDVSAFFGDPDRVIASLSLHIPKAMLDEYAAMTDAVDRAQYLYEDIFQHLSETAPAGSYFGLKQGRYGFFPLPAGLPDDAKLSLPWQHLDALPRCGLCNPCKQVERAKSNVLHCLTQASTRRQTVGDDAAAIWNQILAENPCVIAGAVLHRIIHITVAIPGAGK